MNSKRRTALYRNYDILSEISHRLEEIKGEEEDALDAIPENLTNSERYQSIDEACDNLESAIDALDECIEYIEAATE